MDIRQKFKGMPLWKKYGIIFSALYFVLVFLLVFGSMLRITGAGENDLLGWILIGLVFPGAWLFNIMGIKIVISTSLPLLLLVNATLSFAIGSSIGYLVDRIKKAKANRKTKSLYFLLVLLQICLLTAGEVLAYEINVHETLAEQAFNASVLSNGYLRNLGISQNDKFNDFTPLHLIKSGSNKEDDSPRWLNHFYDPITNRGLNLNGLDVGVSSLQWGKNNINNIYDWDKTRFNYYSALTALNSNIRDSSLAFVFSSLGQLMHLAHDKAVPAHARNDAHFPYANSQRDMYERYTRDAANGLYNFPPLQYTGYYAVDLETFNSFDSFWINGGKGLSEFTNSNFVSRNTNIDDQAYALPVGIPESGIFTETVSDPEAGEINVNVKYLLGYVTDQYRSATSPAVRLAAYSYFDFETQQIVNQPTFSLNNQVHREYANILIPRAVGYTAGLLNYFFRGTLEISAPDQFVYAIADGSQNPHQFTTLNAKVKNTTSNENVGAGTLQAVARYKKRTDSQPDLSTDPPTAESREADFSYSVSAPITITSLDATTPAEFTFDFTSSPIPAGVTDLYLQVVFKGTLGNEIDTAVAVGMKDINEPMHIVVWNATDRFYLDHVLRTADEIRNDPTLSNRSVGQYIDPYNLTTKLAFTASEALPTAYHVTYAPFPYGRYGRVIILTDTPSFYMHVHRESTDPVDSLDSHWPVSGIVNQEIDGIFNNTQVYTFRTIIGHEWSAFARYYPDPVGIETAPWPAPVDNTPFPATISQ